MSTLIINIRIHKFHIGISKKGMDKPWIGIGRLRFSINPNYQKSWGLISIST